MVITGFNYLHRVLFERTKFPIEICFEEATVVAQSGEVRFNWDIESYFRNKIRMFLKMVITLPHFKKTLALLNYNYPYIVMHN